jgi:hypothetical protein
MGARILNDIDVRKTDDDVEVRFISTRRGTRIVALAIHLPSGAKEYSDHHTNRDLAEKEARELLARNLPSKISMIEKGERAESSYFSRMSKRI